jgi:hypothetical protein
VADLSVFYIHDDHFAGMQNARVCRVMVVSIQNLKEGM